MSKEPKYRLGNYRLGGFQILKWHLPKPKPDGTISKGKWVDDGYYPTIEVAVSVLLKQEIEVIDAPLREQLEQLPKIIEEARDFIVNSLELQI